MRIAVASEGLEVSPHAGHCSSFTCYTVNRGVITECQNLPNPGVPGATMAELFQDVGVDVLVCGGIDMDMANAFCHAGIEVVAGAAGSVRRVAESYLNHTLIGTEGCATCLTRRRMRTTKSWRARSAASRSNWSRRAAERAARRSAPAADIHPRTPCPPSKQKSPRRGF